MGSSDSVVLYANTLTMLNTSLLLYSGVVSVSLVHTLVLKTLVMSNTMVVSISLLAIVFLGVQCVEYLHLYWCIYSYAMDV